MSDPTETIRRISMRLSALSESGLAYCKDYFDIGRFHEIGALANELMELIAAEPVPEYRKEVAIVQGYMTPKVEVRGVIFNDAGEVLLTREKLDNGRWTLPGGWCDPTDPPSEAVEREVWEEVGVRAKAYHLAMVLNRETWPHFPKHDRTTHKMFFLCRPETPVDLSFTSDETTGLGWFGVDLLPELSPSRVLPAQIRLAKEQWHNPGPAVFD